MARPSLPADPTPNQAVAQQSWNLGKGRLGLNRGTVEWMVHWSSKYARVKLDSRVNQVVTLSNLHPGSGFPPKVSA